MKSKVILDIEEYNELRDSKQYFQDFQKNKTFTITVSHDRYGYSYSEFITTDEAVKIIAEANKSLVNEINNLKINSNSKKKSFWKFYK